MWQYTDLMYSCPNLEPVCFSMSSSNCCFLTCIHTSQEEKFQKKFSNLQKKNFQKKQEKISTVCCDPHSQRLWRSQYSRSRCFSGTLLLFLWSNGCWQFDLLFLCLSKSSLNIWELSVHILLKHGLENFEHYFASVWDECSCAVVWTFFGIAFIWDWNSYFKQDMKYGHSYL